MNNGILQFWIESGERGGLSQLKFWDLFVIKCSEPEGVTPIIRRRRMSKVV